MRDLGHGALLSGPRADGKPPVQCSPRMRGSLRCPGAVTARRTRWILARIVYLPIYVFGIIYVRTIVWGISIVGLVMMLSRLIGW